MQKISGTMPLKTTLRIFSILFDAAKRSDKGLHGITRSERIAPTVGGGAGGAARRDRGTEAHPIKTNAFCACAREDRAGADWRSGVARAAGRAQHLPPLSPTTPLAPSATASACPTGSGAGRGAIVAGGAMGAIAACAIGAGGALLGGAGPARARVSSVRAWSGPGAPGDILPDGWRARARARAPLRTPRAAIHRSPVSSHRRTRRRPYLVQGPTARRSRWQPPCARQGPAPSAPAGCCARPMRARPVCPRRRPGAFAREPRTHSANGARRR